MISDQFKCIFIEVPKTGSTSIRSIIGEPPKPHQNIWPIFSSISAASSIGRCNTICSNICFLRVRHEHACPTGLTR